MRSSMVPVSLLSLAAWTDDSASDGATFSDRTPAQQQRTVIAAVGADYTGYSMVVKGAETMTITGQRECLTGAVEGGTAQRLCR